MTSLSPDSEDLQRLQAFIIACRENPDILHNPQLTFFKKYIANIGEKVLISTGIKSEIASTDNPDSPMEDEESDENYGANDAKNAVIPNHGNTNKPPIEEEMEQANKKDLEILGSKVPTGSNKHGSNYKPLATNISKLALEIDMMESEENNTKPEYPGVFEPESVAAPGYGDLNKKPTEEEIDRATEKRSEAMTAMSDGELQKAIDLLTEAIKFNPTSVMLYVKRGSILLNQKRVNACIKDCDIAIKLYPDSASAYKFRGRAHRLLGHWVEADKDLKLAWKLDFDEQVDEWLKELNQTLTKLDKHKPKCDQKCAVKKLKKNKKCVVKTYAEKEKNKYKKCILKPQKKSFHCYQCDKVFLLNHTLKHHLRTHTGENPYQCRQCDKAYKKNSSLGRHIMIHSGKKPYQCDQCDKSFSYKHNLKYHMSVHNGKRPYNCSQCEKDYIKSADLKRHILTHTGEKPYQCFQCGKTFNANGNLKKHMLSHTGERPYQCDQCDKTFQHKQHLNDHMNVHNGKTHLCNLCGKAFIHKTSFIIHMKIHNGDLPYQCNQCDKALPTKHYLNRHIKNAHTQGTEGRPFQCPHCGKKFKRKTCLTVHSIIHTNREKLHKCSVCDKAFFSPRELVMHMRVHSEDRKSKVTWERPFKCTQCVKSYKRKTDLTFHMKIHNGERSYQCSHCDKVFNLHSTLISHESIHTGEKLPYQCNLCDNSYVLKCHLRFHMKRAHTNENPSSNEKDNEELSL